jgi:hypothetical protein
MAGADESMGGKGKEIPVLSLQTQRIQTFNENPVHSGDFFYFGFYRTCLVSVECNE